MQTFSFDFSDKWFQIAGRKMAFRVFTEANAYTPDPERCSVRQTPQGWILSADRYTWAGGQQATPGRFLSQVRRIENGLTWTVQAALPERIKTLTTLVRGVPAGDLLTRNLTFEPFGAAVNDILPYPSFMRFPVFAVRPAPSRTVVFVSEDDAVRAKTAAFREEEDGLLVELHHYVDARHWSMEASCPPWRMTRAPDIADAMKLRMQVMEDRWNLRSWAHRRDVPVWAREICLVLNLHGAHWAGYVFNDYSRQLDIIRYVCDRIDGRHVLAFLPAWDGRYNFNWPRYEPDERMGGVAGFCRLVEGAQELGVHLIPQIGATSVNRAFLPPALHDCAFRDAYGNPYVKQLDWDMDRMPETYRIMANIGHPGFRRFLLDKTIGIVERFGVDGIFLDINQAWFNDPSFSPVEGHGAFAEELQNRFDDFLIFGEGWYDGLMSSYPLVHQHHTLPEEHAEVFTRYCRATYHLTHPAPGRGSTGVYERGFLPQEIPDPDRDIIPAIAFVEDTLTEHADEVDRRIDIAKTYGKRVGILA